MSTRLTGMTYIKAKLGSFRLFWSTRYHYLRSRFYWLKNYFIFRESVTNTRLESSALRALAKATVFPIVLAVGLALVVYLLEQKLGKIINWGVIRHTWISKYLNGRINSDSYDQLMGAVAGVTGVFLALYFTAVSTVASSAYATVPQDIRELLIRDRLGNVYVKVVSFLTAFSVLMLASNTAYLGPMHFAIPLVALLSCFSVFAFIRLGQRAFFLADPALLSNTLSAEIMKWAKRASAGGIHWRDINFQEHFRKQARKSVTTLVAMAKLSGQKKELQGDSYPHLINQLTFTVRLYLASKSKIPSESRWFGKTYKHKQWYLTESTEIDLATQTDSVLKPNEVPDTNWVEDALLRTVVDALNVDVNDANYEALYDKLVQLPGLFETFGSHWDVETGQLWFKDVSKNIIAKLAEQTPGTAESRKAFSIAAADIVSSLPLSLELGFIKRAGDTDITKLRKRLSKTKWINSKAPYQYNLPANTVKILEQVTASALFEKKAHSKHRAPGWYVVELAFNNFDWNVYRHWQTIMKLIDEWYFAAADTLLTANKPVQAAAVLDRALELAWKLERHIGQLKTMSENLRKDSKLDYKRPPWDWNAESVKVVSFRKKAIDAMAKLIPQLLPEPPDSDTPDYFGHAVHTVGEACFDALLEGDVDRFKKLFTPYFVGILGAFEKVRPQVLEWEPSNAITWMSEPLIDLVDISGYAFIMSEYYGKPELWTACQRPWNTWLSDAAHTTRMQILANCLYHHQHLFALSPRSTLRSSREIRLSRLLSQLPRQGTPPDPYSRAPVQHDSPFIRHIVRGVDMTMFYQGAVDIFSIKYLIAREDAASLDLGVSADKIRDLERADGDSDD